MVNLVASASAPTPNRPADSALGKRPRSENNEQSLSMNRSPVGPSAGATFSSGPMSLSSLYGKGVEMRR
jgi:hypothetical protein